MTEDPQRSPSAIRQRAFSLLVENFETAWRRGDPRRRLSLGTQGERRGVSSPVMHGETTPDWSQLNPSPKGRVLV